MIDYKNKYLKYKKKYINLKKYNIKGGKFYKTIAHFLEDIEANYKGRLGSKYCPRLIGRVLRGNNKNDFKKLSMGNRKLVFLTPNAIDLLNKNTRDLLKTIGYDNDFIDEIKNQKIKLSILGVTADKDIKLATWDNVLKLFCNVYSELCKKIKDPLWKKKIRNIKLVKNSNNIECQNNTFLIDNSITYDKVFQNPTILNVRHFMNNVENINNLFKGDGYTYDEFGNKKIEEFITQNKIIDFSGNQHLIDLKPIKDIIKINVVFANISWVIQQGLIMGSEKDMAIKCKNKYNEKKNEKSAIRSCWFNTVELLKNLKNKFDVLGLVEIGNMGSYKKTLDHIKILIYNKDYEIVLGKIESNTRNNINSKLEIYAAIIYNKSILGDVILSKTVNLSKNDGRPCCMVATEKCIFVCVHTGWIVHCEDKQKYENIISQKLTSFIKKCLRNKKNDKKIKNLLFHKKIILMGDFNDEHTLINKDSPFKINIKLNKNYVFTFHNNKSKFELKNTFGSCCWHELGHIEREPKHGPQKFKTGDYILWHNNVNNNDNNNFNNNNNDSHIINKKDIKNINAINEKLNHSSDHKFIIANIII